MKPESTKIRIGKLPEKEVTMRCDVDTDKGIHTLVFGGQDGPIFKCPSCGMKLFVTDNLEISSHGQTKKSVKHSLLSVKELGLTE